MFTMSLPLAPLDRQGTIHICNKSYTSQLYTVMLYWHLLPPWIWTFQEVLMLEIAKLLNGVHLYVE